MAEASNRTEAQRDHDFHAALTKHLVCRAHGCLAAVPPSRLMCWPHWKAVPYALRKAVLDAYVPEQLTAGPSKEYLVAAVAAVGSVDGVTTDGRHRR